MKLLDFGNLLLNDAASSTRRTE